MRRALPGALVFLLAAAAHAQDRADILGRNGERRPGGRRPRGCWRCLRASMPASTFPSPSFMAPGRAPSWRWSRAPTGPSTPRSSRSRS